MAHFLIAGVVLYMPTPGVWHPRGCRHVPQAIGRWSTRFALLHLELGEGGRGHLERFGEDH